MSPTAQKNIFEHLHEPYFLAVFAGVLFLYLCIYALIIWSLVRIRRYTKQEAEELIKNQKKSITSMPLGFGLGLVCFCILMNLDPHLAHFSLLEKVGIITAVLLFFAPFALEPGLSMMLSRKRIQSLDNAQKDISHRSTKKQ